MTWHKLQAKGELTKKLGLSLQQQLRLRDNSSSVDETFTDISLNYDLPKGFDVGVSYRLAWSPNKDSYYENQHRYSIDASYSRKIWNLKAKFRARFQHRPDASLFNERLKPEDSPIFVRLKLSVTYDKFIKWKPGIDFESFIRTDNPNELGARKFRYTISVDYALSNRQELGLFYMLQTDYSGSTHEFVSVVGVSYTYEWKRTKKKKQDKTEE
ncbi:MAG: DUF2490 domain-containing protein [Flavobacteriales bacterium]|nr:DUF2490 domain-containing protein [Flavobacteriales bacterium]